MTLLDHDDHTDEAFRRRAREWIERSLPSGWTPASALHSSSESESFEVRRRWQRAMFEGGWAGLAWPVEYGGQGASLTQVVLFNEEAAKLGAPEPLGGIGLNMVGPTIIHWGTDAQRSRYLPSLLSGDEIWCQGFSEPDAGSDLASLRTRAERRGDEYVINGQKVWTSYAHLSRFCMLLTRTGEAKGDKHQGLTCMIVDMHQPGVEVRPLRQASGDSTFNEVFFNDAVTPVDNRLGPEGQGWSVAITTLMHERGTLPYALHATSSILFDELVKMTQAQGFADDEGVRTSMSNIYLDLEALRLANERALPRLIADGGPGPQDSVRKLLWERIEQRIGELAMGLLGTRGHVTAGPESVADGLWPYQYMRGRARSIEAGTTEILKSIVAERALGLPRSR